MVVAQALHHGRRDSLLDFDPCGKALAPPGAVTIPPVSRRRPTGQRPGCMTRSPDVGLPKPSGVQKGRLRRLPDAEPAIWPRCVERWAQGPPWWAVTVKHRIGIDDQVFLRPNSWPSWTPWLPPRRRFQRPNGPQGWLSGLEIQSRTARFRRWRRLVHRLKARTRPELL